MSQGMYIAASGSLLQEKRLEVLANNLANASTSGYKEDKICFESILIDSEGIPLDSPSIDPYTDVDFSVESFRGTYPKIYTVTTNFSQGDIKFTGNKFDFALQGPGFFKVDTPNGPRYTRAGTYMLNNKGTLVTSEGYPLDGKGINDLQSEFVVDARGNIVVDGVQKGNITIVEFDNPEDILVKEGKDLYALKTKDKNLEKKAENTTVKQGFLEMSNINVIKEMVKLIEATRIYESFQKAIISMNESSQKAINEVGRLG